MKVLVIGGGISDERPVSLRSAQAVRTALEVSHEVVFYDWDGSNEWLANNARQYDVVFPVLHGVGGEDGQIQSILEDLGCTYVGTDAQQSELCMDKQQTRRLLASQGILLPKGQMVNWEQYQDHSMFNQPHVLKPVTGGSSIDTYIFSDVSLRNIADLQQAFAKYSLLLLEEHISGLEITVPILDGKDLPVIEIIPPIGATFDYENKYNGTTQELCPPQNVTDVLQAQAKELAQHCHKVMGCRDLSRTDMILKDETIYVLEINTMPGLTDQSLFPRAAATAGMNMQELTNYLIQTAHKRKVT